MKNQFKKIKKRVFDYFMITVASVIYSVAISLFLDPNNIAPGGITGVAILINRYVAIPVGTINLLLNIPILILGLWKFGFRFIFSTFYALGAVTVFANYLARFNAITNDLLIAGVLGGGFLAVSMAMIFEAGATTGGSDIIVKLLRLRWKHLKTGNLFLITDIVVILASWIVFRDLTVAFYAGVAVSVNAVVMDLIMYGPDGAKLIYIITDKPEPIVKRILEELDITATLIDGQGAYTREDKKVVMVVMRKQMAPKTKEIVKLEDPEAFMIVSSASEIFGEGYKDIKKNNN